MGGFKTACGANPENTQRKTNFMWSKIRLSFQTRCQRPRGAAECKMYYERLKLVPDILEAAKQDHICKIAIFDVTKAEQNTYPALQELNRRFRVLLSGEQWVDVMNRK